MTVAEGGEAAPADRLHRALGQIPVVAFIAALAGGVGLCWLVALHRAAPEPAPLRLPWPVLAAAFALGHYAVVRVDFRGESHTVDLTDVALLPALVFAGAGPVLLAAGAGTAIRSLLDRRPAMKASFNVSLHMLVVALAALCYRAVLGHARATSLHGLLAAVIAVLVAETATHLGIQAVISISVRSLVLPRLDETGRTLAVMVGLDVVLGMTAVELLWSGRLGGSALFAALAAVMGTGYAVYGRLHARHARLDQLYRFEQSLSGVAERDDVIAAVLGEALKLLDAETAQLSCSEGRATRYHTLRRGEPAPVTVLGTCPLAAFTDAITGDLLAPKKTPDPALRRALRTAEVRDALAVRLPAEGDARWVLVVCNRMGSDYVTFTAEDLSLAATLAATAAGALRKSGQLDELRSEVALKDHQASHDGLTGLANRRLFSAELDRALASRPDDGLVGVMLFDLNGFKKLNDTLGHEAGDLCLQLVAQRVEGIVGAGDVVSRLGGDEFAVLLADPPTLGRITDVAEEIDRAVKLPVTLADSTVRLGASVGVAVAPLCGEERFAVLRQADLAMYRAKRAGGGVRVFQEHQEVIDRFSIIDALREAIGTSALHLAYQPQVSFVTGAVTGVEALLRWTHPTYGRIPLDEVIPVAEASGLLQPITTWVLETALTQAAEWRAGGLDLDVAVNISPEHIGDPAMLEQLRRLLARLDLPGRVLTLEITESGVVRDWGDNKAVVDALGELGVRLAIDDFGVAGSSFTRLKDLRVNELKVDKSFVETLSTSSTDAAIVRAVIDLAHQLGITVTAEGIETASAYRHLAGLGCDVAQGHFISVPLPPGELTAWLRARAGAELSAAPPGGTPEPSVPEPTLVADGAPRPRP